MFEQVLLLSLGGGGDFPPPCTPVSDGPVIYTVQIWKDFVSEIIRLLVHFYIFLVFFSISRWVIIFAKDLIRKCIEKTIPICNFEPEVKHYEMLT